MNTTPIRRLVAAAASFVVTWTLFSGVAMLAAPSSAEASLVAQAPAIVVVR